MERFAPGFYFCWCKEPKEKFNCCSATLLPCERGTLRIVALSITPHLPATCKHTHTHRLYKLYDQKKNKNMGLNLKALTLYSQ